MRSFRLVVSVSLFACAAVGLSADVVVMNDGSRIIGKVQRLEDGNLKLETDFAGTLEINAGMVKSIETDEAVNVEMTTGDKLVGPMQWQPDVGKGLVQTELGGVPFSTEMVQSIWKKGDHSPEELKLELRLSAVEAEYQAKMPKWALSLEAGLRAQEGNTERINAMGKVVLSRTTDKDLLKLYASGEYGEESDVRNTAEVKVGALYEYMLTERFFAYGRTEFEYDEFENLDLRATFALGGGYYWLKQEDHEYKTRIGAGYRHESFMDGTQQDEPILELGHDYRLDIAPWLQFVHSLTYNPSLEEFREYTLVADQALLIPLSNSEVWKLKLGALYEYDAVPSPGVERLDQTYYANIVAELK